MSDIEDGVKPEQPGAVIRQEPETEKIEINDDSQQGGRTHGAKKNVDVKNDSKLHDENADTSGEVDDAKNLSNNESLRLIAERDNLVRQLHEAELRRERDRFNYELEMSRMEADAARKEADLLREMCHGRLGASGGLPRRLGTESTPVSTPSMPKLSKFTDYDQNPRPENVEVHEESVQLQNILELSRLQFQSQADTLRLPPTELPKFDGDPLNYHQFMKRFKSMVDKPTVSDADKLLRLYEACTGKAKTAVNASLNIDDPSEGYSDAMKRLRERFGNPHKISQAWITRVLDEPDVKTNDRLRDFADLLRTCRDTLAALDCLAELDNRRTLGDIIKKLPYDLKNKWLNENYKITNVDGRIPKLADVVKFVEREAEKRCDPIFGAIMGNNSKDQKKDPKDQKKDSKNLTRKNFSTVSVANVKCPKCNELHFLNQCSQFRNMSVVDRTKFVKDKGLCKNCFKAGHLADNCPKAWVCNLPGCGQKHNRWLHPVDPPRNPAPAPASDNKTSEVKCGYAGGSNKKVCLPIVPVILTSGSISTTTYALLDPGANSSLVAEDIAARLKLSRKSRSPMSIDTVTGTGTVVSEVVDLEVKSINNDPFSYLLKNVRTLPRLNIGLSCLASKEDCAKWPHLEDIPMADTSQADDVSLIIGQDHPDLLRPEEIRVGVSRAGEPYATRTVLGWAINGPIDSHQMDKKRHSQYFVNTSHSPDLNESVQKFWHLDDPEALKTEMSIRDQKVLDFWEDSAVKDNENYSLKIPFKTEVSLPDNYSMAKHRLDLLGKKLAKNDELKRSYTQAVEKNLQSYAEEVSEKEIERRDGKVWYLPHHAVVHPKKGKLRVVYDCSAKFRGTSLNDVVFQGPDLTNKLIDVLLKFRHHKIALMADIEGMFNQVKVHPDDRDVLRFLWWRNSDPNETTVTYRMTSHLFGGVWSPSCANYALHKCAKDYAENYDVETVRTVLENFYVDDCLKSVDTELEAIRLAEQLTSLLSQGGFHLTKWISNSRGVLMTIPEEEHASSVPSLDLDTNLPVERALGTLWRTESDSFGFDINSLDADFTKRGLLRVISSVYDPLGLAGPFVINGKMLFQLLCRTKLGWDDPMPEEIKVQWRNWLDDLPSLSRLQVPRCLQPVKRLEVPVKAQLHHFCDASEAGYGSVSYLRFSNDETVHCALVMSKNRLAPIKQQTIPRLELCAAVVAANVDKKLTQCLDFELLDSVFWTDSMIVLHYLRNEEKKFQTFVANRVSQILDCTDASQWRHVGTHENPADDLSRGLSASELLLSDRWLKGPSFLWKSEEFWPKQPEFGELPPSAEIKRVPKVYALDENEASLDKFIQRYSSWYRLRRAVALILRLKALLSKTSNVKLRDKIIVTELKNAEIAIFEYVQRKFLVDSNIKKLCPVKIDKLLCVGGRLTNAPITETAKHPILLPAHHHVSRLLVWHYHSITGHGGTERVLAEIRQRFWIVKGRVTVKRVLSTCVPCKRSKQPLAIQRMADLPSERVTPNEAPFAYVGVDYFGPIEVKRARSQVKRYGCLFTCLSTRAIHIEMAFSLDTDSFINCLERYMARRGQPKRIRSDNGSNFVGAKAELKGALDEWNHEQISNHLLQKEIEWVFNPPASSHMGGVWERQIRTVRSILVSLSNQQAFDDETLMTLFCVVEGIVNGRPLTKLSDDPTDPLPLTPNDLLILKSGPSLPPGKFVRQDLLRRRWRQVQYLADIFWTRWVKDYLPELQKRQKWLNPARNFRVGDLILILNENTPRHQWPLGVIRKTNMGADGLVRSVDVQTKTGLYTRPINKLCLLEANLE